jgi:hypothetical protein
MVPPKSSSSPKWYGKQKWLVYTKLLMTDKKFQLYKSLFDSSPKDVGDYLLDLDPKTWNQDLMHHLSTKGTWEPARGTPWNDDKKNSVVVFVADLKKHPGEKGHLRMRLHAGGKIKNFLLHPVDHTEFTTTTVLLAPKKWDWTWNCRRDTRKRVSKAQGPQGPQGPYVRNTCTYARRRKDGEKIISKRCERMNKDCLLAYARTELGSAVTEGQWNKVWESLNR